MAEGASWLAEIVKYLCVAKPLLFLGFYHDDPHKAEELLQYCLINGASYSLFPNPPRQVVKVIESYRPLVEKLLGRRWLLEPNPLCLPGFIDGNIFHGEKNNVLISLVNKRKSCMEKSGLTRNLEISASFKEVQIIRKAFCMGTHYSETRRVQLERKKNELKLVIPEHGAATLVILEK